MDVGAVFVDCDNLVKIYKVADLEVVALQGLDLQIARGDMMALVGASGSGKSTLLNIIGGLDTPSAGTITVGDRDLLNLSQNDRTQYQRQTVGFVWQQPARNLLPYLTALENVEMPMMLGQLDAGQRRKRALELLEMVGLSDRADFRPDRLSGGQQQRVALAIALANNPPLLLADEPTGQVDSASAESIFHALRRLNEAYQTTIIVVTHDPKVSNHVNRVVGIRDGRTSTELRRVRRAEDGELEHEEWVIMDQAGRLQLPKVYVESLGMRGRVKVRLEKDHVSVWPDQVARLVRPEEEPEETMFWQRKDGAVLSARVEEEKMPAVVTHDLRRVFQLGVEEVHAVDGVNLEIPSGKMVVVKGPSGSGKTTLLNLIAGLDEPTTGEVTIGGQKLSDLSAGERVNLRRRQIGFVFQTFGLLPYLSAQENVEVPLRLLRLGRKERRERVLNALKLVGLAERARHRTYELSGGEQQRVALARALVNQPALILADEPTGQLDTITGTNIIALLRRIVLETGVTVVIASHDPKVMEAVDVVFELKDGRLINTETRTQPVTRLMATG
ncbi:MAG: ABC transporter ATP-binding protein [Ardenticatenales bacterium]|nr:ABC transporter ATP-binding protein [Ardenticatenales bacterium]